MNLDMANKVVLITGAAGGIGSATAKLCASQGLRIALFDIQGERAVSLAEQLAAQGHTAMGGDLDVTDYDQFVAAVSAVEARFGGLDFLINVAGGGTRQTLATLSPQDWRKVMDLNLTGPFNGIKAAAPAMRRRGGGSIVTVASLAAIRMSMNNGVSYTAAKSGVLGLTRHAAYELGPDAIRVNAVLPGPVLTPQMRAKISSETLAQVPRELPLGRWVEPEEVAGPLLFYCSSLSSACTGTHVVIDCGLHVGAPRPRDEYVKSRDLES
jgi:NAD(P)-dependent dehydrogenase (short-subunit alcohol dehydrogenase family)